MKKCAYCDEEKAIHNDETSPSLSMVMLVNKSRGLSIVRLDGSDGLADYLLNTIYCPECGKKLRQN